jgi:hypothetical protein
MRANRAPSYRFPRSSEQPDPERLLNALTFVPKLRSDRIQQSVFMTISLDAAIGLTVWLPFMIGKSTALLVVSSTLE